MKNLETLVDILPPTPAEGSRMSDLFELHSEPLSQVAWADFLVSHGLVPEASREFIINERRKRAREGAIALQTIIGLHETIKEARIDPVTSLRTPKAYEIEMPRIFERVAAGELTVLFIDLNGLKRVNNISHAKGNEYLNRSSRSIEASVRPTDLEWRMGGDEIAVALDGKMEEETIALISQRLKMNHAEAMKPLGLEPETYVGLAIGAAIKREDDTLDTFIHRADMACAADKEQFYKSIEDNTGQNLRR